MRFTVSVIPVALFVVSVSVFSSISYWFFSHVQKHDDARGFVIGLITALYAFWGLVYYYFGCKGLSSLRVLIARQVRWVLVVVLLGACWLFDFGFVNNPFGFPVPLISLFALSSAIEAVIVLRYCH